MLKTMNETLLVLDETTADRPLAEQANQLIETRAKNRLSRRNFLASAGVAVGATGALAVAGCGSATAPIGPAYTTAAPVAQVPSPTDVLNFALNLEYLEANFYSYITTGGAIATSLQGSAPGTITGGAQVTFSDPNVTALAVQLATEETAHVQLIQALINLLDGSTPISMPSLNLAALGTVTDDASFLAMARQLETVGTSAYEGGINLLGANTPLTITIAATVHDLEAQHEGALRQFCIAKGITSGAVDSMDVAVNGASGPVFNTSSTTGFNTVRTPSEVLQIVYGTPGVTGTSSGGFYPNGMNGNITTS